jgi:hypothetical protein
MKMIDLKSQKKKKKASVVVGVAPEFAPDSYPWGFL